MDHPEQLPALTRRQEELLAMIVRAYSENPEPVSSKYLAEQPNVTFSSATVRNEMAHLEELGYLTAPHTSAGRIPTTKGFRYFVRGLIERATLDDVEQEIMTQKLNAAPNAARSMDAPSGHAARAQLRQRVDRDLAVGGTVALQAHGVDQHSRAANADGAGAARWRGAPAHAQPR